MICPFQNAEVIKTFDRQGYTEIMDIVTVYNESSPTNRDNYDCMAVANAVGNLRQLTPSTSPLMIERAKRLIDVATIVISHCC